MGYTWDRGSVLRTILVSCYGTSVHTPHAMVLMAMEPVSHLLSTGFSETTPKIQQKMYKKLFSRPE